MGNNCSPCCRKFQSNDVNNSPQPKKYGTTPTVQPMFIQPPSSNHRGNHVKNLSNTNGELRYQLVDPKLASRYPQPSMMVFDEAGVPHRAMHWNGRDQNKYIISPESNVHNNNHYMPNSYQSSKSDIPNLPHISARDPDDTEADPTLNPTKETLFMQHSFPDIEPRFQSRNSMYERNISRHQHQLRILLHRSSSTSTVRLGDSTVSRPDPKSTVRALAQAVYLQIRNRDRNPVNSYIPNIFDERLYPVENEPMSDDQFHRDPDQRVIYRFIRKLFHQAQLSPECAIVTMVYLERLQTSAETELTPITWKRAVLCAILLASKVWDDQAVWNSDYCQILKDLKVNDVNTLERRFLEIIQFNINVPSSVYAKYYFAIRSLSGASSRPFLLSTERARKLEAYSNNDDPLEEECRRIRTQIRCKSLDCLYRPQKYKPAILS